MVVNILLSVLGLVLLVLIIAALMNKKFTLSSSIIINKPSDTVFDYVVHLKNQKHFSKWVMMDPNAVHTYTGTDGTVGFIAAWKSDHKNVGIGEQEITNIEPGKRYDVELRFEKPFKGTNYAFTTCDPTDDSKTQVTTTFNGTTPFPMNIMIPMLKKALLKDMEENAKNLKKVLES